MTGHMTGNDSSGILAIDVGSSRVKLGWFPPVGQCTSQDKPASLPIAAPTLPQPSETLAISHDNTTHLFQQLGAWLQAVCPGAPPAYVASVHPDALAILQEKFARQLTVVTAASVPIEVLVEHPDKVGIDRLLNAVAIRRVRRPHTPAIVIDLGTACTVDRISANGQFEGGAILPGIRLAAEALHSGTAALPRLALDSFAPVEPVGKSTQAAMRSGLLWGMVGAVSELIARMSQEDAVPRQVYLTGGDAPLLAEHLPADEIRLRHIPNLVLSGIALVAGEMS